MIYFLELEEIIRILDDNHPEYTVIERTLLKEGFFSDTYHVVIKNIKTGKYFEFSYKGVNDGRGNTIYPSTELIQLFEVDLVNTVKFIRK